MKFSIVKVIIKGFNLLEVVEEDVVDLLNGLLEVVVFDVVVFLGLEKKDLKFWFLNLLKLILLKEGVFILSLLILLNLRLFLLKLLNLRFFLLKVEGFYKKVCGVVFRFICWWVKKFILLMFII